MFIMPGSAELSWPSAFVFCPTRQSHGFQDRSGRVVGMEATILPEDTWAEHERLYRIVAPWKPFNAGRVERAIASSRRLEARVGKPCRLRARDGVILSAGDYVYSLSMLKRHRQILARSYIGLLRLGSMGCDGNGIALGRPAGGEPPG